MMKTRTLMIAGLFAAAIAATPPDAAAQDESLKEARAAFEKAQGFYERGEFDKAAEEFKRAYKARAFPQFLFNIGASFEKMKKYEEAVKYYEQYVGASKNAGDQAATQKRIEVLKKEIARLATKPPDAVPTEEPSKEVKALKEARPRGLVVIESQPQGATIHLGSKDGEVLGPTPWNGNFDSDQKIFLVKEGYKVVEQLVKPSDEKLLLVVVSMAEQDYLGFVEITSNIPESEIYVDDKSVGVYQKTPWKGNLPPGKHKIWITKEGYNEHYQEIEVVAGENLKVAATLEGKPVGYVNVRGPEIDRNKIYLDGEL
jgi:tetratricopeptide (TPR) repeat protein